MFHALSILSTTVICIRCNALTFDEHLGRWTFVKLKIITCSISQMEINIFNFVFLYFEVRIWHYVAILSKFIFSFVENRGKRISGVSFFPCTTSQLRNPLFPLIKSHLLSKHLYFFFVHLWSRYSCPLERSKKIFD